MKLRTFYGRILRYLNLNFNCGERVLFGMARVIGSVVPVDQPSGLIGLIGGIIANNHIPRDMKLSTMHSLTLFCTVKRTIHSQLPLRHLSQVLQLCLRRN